MKIKSITAREVFNSCGLPTVECELILEDGALFSAMAPTSTSQLSYEAFLLTDNDQTRFNGLGAQKAAETIKKIIAPTLINQEPSSLTMDQTLMELNGTPNIQNLGTNTTLPVSIAVLQAQAYVANLNLFSLIAYL